MREGVKPRENYGRENSEKLRIRWFFLFSNFRANLRANIRNNFLASFRANFRANFEIIFELIFVKGRQRRGKLSKQNIGHQRICDCTWKTTREAEAWTHF
jgi:hypothetical protein